MKVKLINFKNKQKKIFNCKENVFIRENDDEDDDKINK